MKLHLGGTVRDIDPFTLAYLECILWVECDDSDEPLDSTYTVADFAPSAIDKAIANCAAFQAENADDIQAGPCKLSEYSDYAKAGHDFWLTRQGHGRRLLGW